MTSRLAGFAAAIAFLLLAVVRLPAIELRNVLTGYTITTWTERDGVPSGNVWALAQDQQGYLWLGSRGGLVRFDGVNFVDANTLIQAPLPQMSVRSLHVSRDGSLWVGFEAPDGGVSRLHAAGARHYTAHDGLPRGEVSALAEDRDGTMWAGTADGLYRLSSERWTKLSGSHALPQAAVLSAYVDRRGQLFVGAARRVFVRRQSGGTFEEVQSIDVAHGGPATRGMCEDASGAVYVTDPETGIRRLGDPADQVLHPDRGRGWQCLADRQGHLWVATGGEGVWRLTSLDGKAPRIDRVSALTGLAAEGALSLLEDRDGNIWAGGFGGLNRLTPHKVTTLANLGVVTGVAATPDDTVWVGTADGLLEFPAMAGEAPPRRTHLAGSSIGGMHVDGTGTLWAGTDRDVFTLAPPYRSPVRLSGSESLNDVSRIASNSAGMVWMHDAARGLFQWDGTRFTVVPVPPAAAHADITLLSPDRRNRMWAGFARGLIAVWDRGRWAHTYGPEHGLPADVYRDMHEDQDGVMWFGGDRGVVRFEDGRFAVVRGLPGANTIIERDGSHLWLAGSAGIVRVARSELDAVTRDPEHRINYSAYDRSDGIAGSPRWRGERASTRTRDGRLWFVTAEGITVIDARADRAVPGVESVRIDRVDADGREVRPSARTGVQPGTKRLQIGYSVLNLTSPHKIDFRYRLEGFDDGWTDAGPARQVSYSNLPPGEYRFVVEARDRASSRESATAWGFIVEPYFHQTWWFPALIVTGIAVSTLGVWRYHLGHVRRRFSLLFAERARVSRDIHDTMLQDLVGLALQLDDVANDVHTLPPPARDRLARMRNQVEECIRATRRSISHLRSGTVRDTDLPLSLREIGEHATEGKPVAFDFHVEGVAYPCPPSLANQLLAIGQEATTNAVRHGGPRSIAISLRYDDASLTLKVSDDGRGFDAQHTGGGTNGHYGLIGMRERAAAVGGTLSISSRVAGGTTVQATVPVRRPGAMTHA